MRFSTPFFLIVLFFSLLSCQTEESLLEVAPVFSDHMVLQQESEVPIWGSGTPGLWVEIKSGWGKETKVEVNEKGQWQAILETPSYGGPFELVVSCSQQQVVFKEVLIGEVWLASGQSNMEWPMRARIKNQKEEIQNANYPKIRMFTVPRNLNGTNINSAEWKITSPENAKDFSAVAYFFARELNQKLTIPVGIINTSWGGTRVEAWTSIEKLASLAPSQDEAEAIVTMGGMDALQAQKKKENEKRTQANEKYLNIKSISIPESIESWNALEVNDTDFSSPEFDDSSWKTHQASGVEKDFITFETFFEKGSLAEDGVLWFRKSFDLDNPEANFTFKVKGGIDDFDYTYINGILIGNTLACCMDRSYIIPEGLLKEKNNILAIRVLDTGGEGGFRGSVHLESETEKLQLDQGLWRFKHHAFYLNTSIQQHGLTYEKLIQEEPNLKKQIQKGESINNPNFYSILFNTMIQPVMPYGIKGFLWYQGESNVSNHQEYQTLFSGMITDWRAGWGKDLPFYFVQIAPFKYTLEANSQALRDAQRKTLSLEKTGMAITLDIGEENDIHPSNKQDVGYRLAQLALSNDYNQSEVVASGPLYKKQRVHTDYIDLYFDFVGSGLVAKGDLEGFEIAAEDGSFFPAQAEIVGDKIRVSSKKVKDPQRVRYGWENYFEATLFNKEGLPASSFETP
ncbi:MAG: sialate O-acetylesterase [Flavobacteriaceae bacterium]